MTTTPTAPQSSPLPDLRFDAVDLIGRPGSQRRIERTVTAPEIPDAPAALWVRAGDPIALRGSLESVVEGVYASGTATAHLVGECSRCLDPLAEDAEVRIDELFTYPEKVPREMSEEERAEIALLEGDDVDLGALVYDALVLAAPSAPLCRPDCAGLCAECGIRLEEDPDHHHDVIDDRFAALQGFFSADGADAEADGDATRPGDDVGSATQVSDAADSDAAGSDVPRGR